MMRSLFAGVAGLRTHQTRMDVIGNNIANVNTTAYKSQSMVFSDLMYQTTQKASGANAQTGVGGTNARQIGLGSKTGAIKTAIASQGAAQSTNDPFDIMISGDAFFVVSNGSENFFTRDGSFYIDGKGNLAMTSTGYNVMGWQPDPTDPQNIKKGTVGPLRLMTGANMTYPPEATTKATVDGVIDKYDTDVNSDDGRVMNLEFFDNQGYKYTAKLSVHAIDGDKGQFYVKLDNIIDAEGNSIMYDKDGKEIPGVTDKFTFGSGTDSIKAPQDDGTGNMVPSDVMMKNPNFDSTKPADPATNPEKIPVTNAIVLQYVEGEGTFSYVGLEAGLDSGGDDYLTKPFRLGELCSRIRALLRRSRIQKEADEESLLSSGEIQVHLSENRAWRGEMLLSLTATEYRLLCLFLRNKGRIMTRETILNALWDDNGSFVDDNTLSVHIRRLREKVEEEPSRPKHLLTVRGFGYQWKENL